MINVRGWAAGAAAAALAVLVVAPGGGTAAGAAVNPLDGGHGFAVIVEDGATLTSTESEGPVAIGGDLTIGGGYNVALNDAGTYVVGGDARPSALVVGGKVNLTGSTSDVLRVMRNGYVKIGNMAGAQALATDSNGASVNTEVVASGAAYGSTPRIELTTQEPVAAVGPTSPIDFASMFGTFRDRSTQLMGCPENVTLTDASGTPLSRPIAPGTHAYLTLDPNRTNVLDLPGNELANLAELTFTNQPTASGPLLINSGATGSLDWTVPSFAGVSNAQSPYILLNIPGTLDLTMVGGDSLYANLYAPNTNLVDQSPGNIDGTVVVHTLVQGNSSGSGGEMHPAPFNATLDCLDSESPSPSASSSASASTSPSASTPATPPGSASAGPSSSDGTPVPSGATPSGTPQAGGDLPVTGTPLLAIAAAGLALVVTGAIILIRLRRRRTA